MKMISMAIVCLCMMLSLNNDAKGIAVSSSVNTHSHTQEFSTIKPKNEKEN